MESKIRWGILGTGNVAREFITDLGTVADAEILAVGSRSKDNAERFAKTFNIPRQHVGYENLANDCDIDVVYVATPHPFHMENTIMCLRAGKAVLCEKPFALNASQARQMVRVAMAQKKFLMEAMWTRFLPIIVKVRQWLADGVIGQVRMLQANFCFRGDWGANSRYFNPRMAGGALMDFGVYTVSLASMIFGGRPRKIAATGHIGQTGVDEQSAMIFTYDSGLAILTCAIAVGPNREVMIFGTKGTIRIAPVFHCGSRAVLAVDGKDEREVDTKPDGIGFCYEAREVISCLRDGRLQSNVVPLNETVEIMETMDEIRSQLKLKFPIE